MVKLIGRNSALRNQAPKDWLGKFYDTAFSDASVASDWIPVIASWNGVTHLEEGLSCSWGSLMGKNRGSGTWTTRWCAYCLEESHREGGAFLPAAWSVGLITACSLVRATLYLCSSVEVGQPVGK